MGRDRETRALRVQVRAAAALTPDEQRGHAEDVEPCVARVARRTSAAAARDRRVTAQQRVDGADAVFAADLVGAAVGVGVARLAFALAFTLFTFALAFTLFAFALAFTLFAF